MYVSRGPTCDIHNEEVLKDLTDGLKFLAKQYNAFTLKMEQRGKVVIENGIRYIDVSKISKLDIKESTTNEISKFLDLYYDNFTGLYIKSKKFLKNLTKI